MWDIVRNHKKEIRTLIEVYMERGGLQFQVNSVSSKLLRDAMENPEESQKEFIERFEKEGY